MAGLFLERSGRFKVIRTLGEGGMGLVYEAFDSARQLTVALKALRTLNRASLKLFKREFRSVADLSHPNIVTLYELFHEDDQWFFTMELVEGTDFMSYVNPVSPAPLARPRETTITGSISRSSPGGSGLGTDSLTGSVGPQPVHSAAAGTDMVRLRASLSQLGGALVALHRAGMVHRDIKPSNVWVRPDGRVVLMDFGIVAHSNAGDDRTIGTPLFAAPEQLRGETANPSADWYSFGVLLFAALTGQLPFSGPRREMMVAKQTEEAPSPAALAADLPVDLVRLCTQLLRLSPSERPSGERVLAALGGVGQSAFDLRSQTTAGEFIGRERELAHLHHAYGTMCGGRAVSTFIVAPSGMGKSTLLSEFTADLTDLPVPPTILRGHCHERESVPFKAVDGVVDGLARALSRLPGKQVSEILPAESGPLTRLFPVLSEVLTLNESGTPRSDSAPEDLLPNAIASLRQLLSRLTKVRPLVLIIDDVHWTDEDSADLLVELFRSTECPQCLLVCTARAENFAKGEPAARLFSELEALLESFRIDLGPLSESEQRQMVEGMLGERLSSELDAQYAAESAGSPLLLAEIVRYIQERDEGDEGELPGLHELLGRRIGRLSADARSLLEIISIIDEPIPLHIASDCVPLSPAAREQSASVLRNGRMIRVASYGDSPWVTPYHDRVRETAVANLSAARQRDLHRAVAGQLEAWDEATVDALAQHWRAAGDTRQAAKYLVSAAAGAAQKLAYRRAANLYGAAIELGELAADRASELRGERARCLAMAGCYAEAGRAYQQAAKNAPDSDAVRWTRLAGDNFLRSGQIVEGMAALRVSMAHMGHRLPSSRMGAVLSLVWQRARLALRGLQFRPRHEREIDPAQLSQVDSLYAAATALGMTDQIRGADLQARHIREALRAGEPHRVCRALAIESMFRSFGASYEKATDFAQRVLRRALDSDDPFLIGMAYTSLWAANHVHFRSREAVDAASEAIACFDECVGADWEQLTARHFWIEASIRSGDLGGAVRESGVFLDDPRRRKDRFARGVLRTKAAVWECLLADRPDRAHAELDSAMEGWPTDEYFHVHHLACMSRVFIFLYEGREQNAAALIEKTRGPLRRSALLLQKARRVQYYLEVARAGLATGNRRSVEKSIRQINRGKFPLCNAFVAALRGAMAAKGDRAQAVLLYLESVRGCHQFGYRPYCEAYRYRLGELVGGNAGERLQQRGIEWFVSEGARAPLCLIDALAPAFRG